MIPVLGRKKSYQLLFGEGQHGDAKVVLADLKRFSRYPEPPVVRDGMGRVDPVASAVLIGRQEMFNRIAAMLHLDLPAVHNLRDTPDE